MSNEKTIKEYENELVKTSMENSIVTINSLCEFLKSVDSLRNENRFQNEIKKLNDVAYSLKVSNEHGD